MKPGIIMALIASFAVVGWATWYRLASSAPQANLVAVQSEKAPEAYYDELISNFTTASTSPSTASAETLTNTDLVGRQLVSDYISLAQSGDATDANLTSLAEKYVESIPTIISANELQILNLHVVSNNQANISSYTSNLESIYQKYASNLTKASNNGSLSLDNNMSVAAGQMSKVYSDTAEKLKVLPVPADFAELHLALTNIYLNDVVAMSALAQFSDDPTSSFAGLIAYRQNADKEVEIISKIEAMATEHGI